MEIQGKLHVKMDTQSVTETFRRREFVVEYADNPLYPQHVLFQLTQDRCSLIDELRLGDVINVTFNLRGREWTSPQGEKKYFNTLEAWRISKADTDPAAPPASNGGFTNSSSLPSQDDDLPW